MKRLDGRGGARLRAAAVIAAALAAGGLALAGAQTPQASPSPPPRGASVNVAEARAPISLEGFSDAINHWRSNREAPPAYTPDQYKQIADNLLVLQRDHGGWIQNQDPTRIFTDAERGAYVADKAKPDISFDNRNVYTQVTYLAEAFNRSGDARYRDAAVRGIEASLRYQVEACGGWPHTMPAHETYNDKITFADEVTSGMLVMLREASSGAGPFGFLDAPTRAKARAALDKGEACVLRLQVVQQGKRTGWAGQYDRTTLEPSMGRRFELPSITSQESVAMVRYLMSVPDPSPEMIAAIDGCLEWLERSKITGWRLETVRLNPPVRYQYHTATEDRRLVTDASAPPIWARFYDLNDNSVVLANRDSQRVQRYDQIDPERRTGYSWYGQWPARLLERDAPRWRQRHPH
jgi:PelA/Pel-15E family pectate lyase